MFGQWIKIVILLFFVQATSQEYVEYHIDDFQEEQQILLLEPESASVTPTTVVGGVNQMIHISRPEGGFGEPNRLYWQGGSSYAPGNIEYWDDTDIYCEVPTNARTGQIRIFTKDSVNYYTNSLYVKYGLNQASGQDSTGAYKRYRPVHIATNSDGSVTWHFGTGMSPSLKSLIRFCASKWTEVNYVFSDVEVDIHAHTPNDGLNVITIGQSPGAASASSAYMSCGGKWYYYDTDIVLDERRDEEAITHEFGHTVGHAHQYNNVQSVMKPSGGNGGDPGAVDLEGMNNSIQFGLDNPVPCFPSMSTGTLATEEYTFFRNAKILKYIDLMGRIIKEKTYLAEGIYIVEYEYNGKIARRLELITERY